MKRRHRLVDATCCQCGAGFQRAPCDLRRSGRHFCSIACRTAGLRRPVSMGSYTCAGCETVFQRPDWGSRRRQKTYCSRDCYWASVDRAALGRRGGSQKDRRPTDPAVLADRARRGGLARARNLSPERLREIAMLGVAARTRSSAVKSGLGVRAGTLVVFGVRLGRR